jgi:hypothetical protein
MGAVRNPLSAQSTLRPQMLLAARRLPVRGGRWLCRSPAAWVFLLRASEAKRRGASPTQWRNTANSRMAPLDLIGTFSPGSLRQAIEIVTNATALRAHRKPTIVIEIAAVRLVSRVVLKRILRIAPSELYAIASEIAPIGARLLASNRCASRAGPYLFKGRRPQSRAIAQSVG